MSAYETTKVPAEQSKAMIEKLLRARGVTDTRFTQTATLVSVEFNWPLRDKTGECSGSGYSSSCGKWSRHPKHPIFGNVTGVLGVRMVAPWPSDPADDRRIMRVLYWHLKSKLETVEAGVLTFAEEFMPHLTLGRGRRVWDEFAPRLAATVAQGKDLSTDMERIAGESIDRALPSGEAV